LLVLLQSLNGIACCRINRLADRAPDFGTATFEVLVSSKPSIRFIRHERSHSRFVAKPGPEHAFSEKRFEEVLQFFGPNELASAMTDVTPVVFEKILGWQSAGEGSSADIELRVVIEEYCLSAFDGLSDVDIDCRISAELVDTGNNELVWRDCMEWRSEKIGVSVYDLSHMPQEDIKQFVVSVSESLANWLAQRITADMEKN